jgi:serine/threonine protein phosphatase 1
MKERGFFLNKLTALQKDIVGKPDRLMAIGDIHGQYSLLRKLIEEEIKFDASKDALVFLGDYIDRGKATDDVKVINYLINLANNNPGRVLLLRGNHEDIALRAITTDDPELFKQWERYGAGDKLCWSAEMLEDLAAFCAALPKYWESEEFLFVHAGAYRNINIAKQSDNTLLYHRGEHFGYDSNGHVKKLVVGHSQTDLIKVSCSEHAICVDLGAFKTGALAAYDVMNNTQFIASNNMRAFHNRNTNS